MNLSIPHGWMRVDYDTFWALLNDVNWSRDAWGNGEYFEVKGYDTTHQERWVDGIRTVRRRRRVALRLVGDRHYIDHTFFKPVTK